MTFHAPYWNLNCKNGYELAIKRKRMKKSVNRPWTYFIYRQITCVISSQIMYKGYHSRFSRIKFVFLLFSRTIFICFVRHSLIPIPFSKSLIPFNSILIIQKHTTNQPACKFLAIQIYSFGITNKAYFMKTNFACLWSMPFCYWDFTLFISTESLRIKLKLTAWSCEVIFMRLSYKI